MAIAAITVSKDTKVDALDGSEWNGSNDGRGQGGQEQQDEGHEE
jgi:hypothetical protein